ncbi:hypothetical protein ACFIJ5_06470 [Haloimpatiens sp. FM7330]|uniref:hypothetical protein n=1 Tax=Haloimpatiens sp. FM7330 TaxID=3298610 RepID=UPI003638AF2A
MNDVTFGVKVNKELKEKISGLMKESGLQGKDFMQNLVNLYEIETSKTQIPEIAQDITELQCLTQRMNNIYLNLANRIQNINKTQNEIFEKKIKEKEEKIYSLENNLKQLKLKNENTIKQIDNLKILNEKIESTISQLKDTNDSNKLLIEEYKEKLHNFSLQLEKYKQYDIKLTKYEECIHTLENKNSILKNTMENLKENHSKEISQKNTEVKTLQNHITSLENEQNKTIERLKDKFELEKGKDLLEIEKSYQNKINNLTNEYNDKIKELLNELELSKVEKSKQTIEDLSSLNEKK